MENKLYTRDEVHMLMCQAFEQGFKKANVVEAGLEALETDVECAWILTRFDSTPNKNNFHQYTPYQLCPKCYGDGNLLRYNSPNMMSTTAAAICDVCNGNKIITMSK